MQKKVQIISDGSQDLSPELSKEKDIEVVPFYVSFDGEHYYKEIEEITVRDFYQQMVDHPDVFPKTSMPSVQDFYEVFEKSVKENIPVICICITAKFSGSCLLYTSYPYRRNRSKCIYARMARSSPLIT